MNVSRVLELARAQGLEPLVLLLVDLNNRLHLCWREGISEEARQSVYALLDVHEAEIMEEAELLNVPSDKNKIQ